MLEEKIETLKPLEKIIWEKSSFYKVQLRLALFKNFRPSYRSSRLCYITETLEAVILRK